MALSSPRAASVDRSRAGVLSVALPVLRELLALPPGHEIAAAQIDASGGLELLIEGGDLPPRREDGSAVRVTLIVTVHGRSSAGLHREMREAAWAHAPDRRWVLRPWGERQ